MYSVIDIGSNTIRLVIYRVEHGRLWPILNNKRAAGLAGYVNEQDCLSREGVEKLVGILLEFREILNMLPDCRNYPFATASLRNVKNSAAVLEEVEARCGMKVRLLSGQEEAMLDYRGAVRAMEHASGILTDVGGGSTELVFFRDGAVQAAGSLPLGSLNLFRRFCGELFPTEKELSAMEKAVEAALDGAIRRPEGAVTQRLCAVGGSARAVLALYRHASGSPESVREYPAAYLEELLSQGLKKPKKLLHRVLKLAPDRVHTLLPGALILRTVVRTYAAQYVLTSACGVREGYLESMLEAEEHELSAKS